MQNNFLVKSPNLLPLKLKILGSEFRMQKLSTFPFKTAPLNAMEAGVLKRKPQNYIQAEKK